MQIHAVRTSFFTFVSLAALFASSWMHAQQVQQAPPEGNQPRLSAPNESVAISTNKNGETNATVNAKPEEGSLGSEAALMSKQLNAKAISADAIGVKRFEDLALRSRFDKYLHTAEINNADLMAYNQKMDSILALLQQKRTFEAWKELQTLAEYQTVDAGIARELAHRIESIWSVDKASAKIDKENSKISENIKASNRNADMMSESLEKKEARMARLKAKEQENAEKAAAAQAPLPQLPAASTPTAPVSVTKELQGKLQLTEEYLKSLESKAKIKINELKINNLFDKSKSEFADYITTLYNSGRYGHVVLAADFYRRIFEEDVYPVTMANQVTATLEANRSIESAVEVFNYNMEKGQVSSATDRLQEAFAMSEVHPALLGVSRQKKEQVSAFLVKLDRLKNLIEAREFGDMEDLLNVLKKEAQDYDTTKPRAIVNAVKLQSKLRLGKAKLAAQQGDLKIAMEEFQAAAEAWPGNPELQDKATTFFDSQDVKTQTLVEFDRLVVEKNYRGIFEKQVSFAPAMKDDLKRQEQFKDALEKIKFAEVASEKANTMAVRGDYIGAWETVELASKDLPDDKKLNQLRADLSSRSAEFVSAISKAQDAENKKNLGYSLTWYVNAQKYYPPSQIANEAIERLSREILSSSN